MDESQLFCKTKKRSHNESSLSGHFSLSSLIVVFLIAVVVVYGLVVSLPGCIAAMVKMTPPIYPPPHLYIFKTHTLYLSCVFPTLKPFCFPLLLFPPLSFFLVCVFPTSLSHAPTPLHSLFFW